MNAFLKNCSSVADYSKWFNTISTALFDFLDLRSWILD
jgi:hypothetical protein